MIRRWRGKGLNAHVSGCLAHQSFVDPNRSNDILLECDRSPEGVNPLMNLSLREQKRFASGPKTRVPSSRINRVVPDASSRLIPSLEEIAKVNGYITSLQEYAVRLAATKGLERAPSSVNISKPPAPSLEEMRAYCRFYHIPLDPKQSADVLNASAEDEVQLMTGETALALQSQPADHGDTPKRQKPRISNLLTVDTLDTSTMSPTEEAAIYQQALEIYSDRFYQRLKRTPRTNADETSVVSMEQSEIDKACSPELPAVLVAFDNQEHVAYLHVPSVSKTVKIEGFDDLQHDHFDSFSKLVSYCQTSAAIFLCHSLEDMPSMKHLQKAATKCGFLINSTVTYTQVLECLLHFSKRAKKGLDRLAVTLGPAEVEKRTEASRKLNEKINNPYGLKPGSSDGGSSTTQFYDEDDDVVLSSRGDDEDDVPPALSLSSMTLGEQLSLFAGKGDGKLPFDPKAGTTDFAKLFFSKQSWELLGDASHEASLTGVVDVSKFYSQDDAKGNGGMSFAKGSGVKGGPITPGKAINLLSHPRADVLCIGLTAVGRGGRSLSVLNLRTGKRTTGYGSMESIVDGLLKATHIGPVILVPNTSADPHDLNVYRTQLAKFGRQIEIVNTWHLVENHQIRQGDSGAIRDILCDKLGIGTADLIFLIKARAAVQIRRRILKSTSTYLAAAASTTRQMLGDNGEDDAGVGTDREEETVLHPTLVKQYLAELYEHPSRNAAEKEKMKSFGRFILCSIHRTMNNSVRRFGNPHTDDNYAFAMGFSDYRGNMVFPTRLFGGKGDAKFPALVDNYDVIVMHDAQSYLLLLWEDPELQRFLKLGGKVWCTKLGEFYLKAQRAEIHDLLSVATGSYGVKLKIPENKEKNIVEKRTLSEVRLDVTTELMALAGTFVGQIKAAVNQVQLISLESRFESLLALVEIEKQGIYIDRKRGVHYALQLRRQLDDAQMVLKDHSPPQIPLDYFHLFEWANRQHLDAFFFGGEVSFGRPRYTNIKLINKFLVELAQSVGKLGSLARHPALNEYCQHVLQDFVNKDRPLTRHIDIKQLNSVQQVEQVEKFFAHRGSDRIPDDLAKFRMVVFDLETTGLNVTTDRIVELSFFDTTVALDEGGDSNKQRAWFNHLINPGRSIPPEVTSIHGIDERMVANCPKFRDIAKDLLKFLRVGPYQTDPEERVILLSHSTWAMDEPMLRQEFLRNAGVALGKNVFFADTFSYFAGGVNKQKLGRAAGDKGSLSLKSLKATYGIQDDGAAHRADADVRVCWKTMLKAISADKLPNFSSQYKAVLETLLATATVRNGMPNASCALVPTDGDMFQRKQPPNISVTLPGVVKTLFPTTWHRVVKTLRKRNFDNVVFREFAQRGCVPAEILLRMSMTVEKNNNILDLAPCDTKLNFMYPDGCIRQTVELTSVVTTRTTSSNPSAHSIPKSDISDMRSIFTSRYGKEGLIVEIDYATLEIAVQAVLCKDVELLKVLNTPGADYHLVRAAWLDSSRSYEEMKMLKEDGDAQVIALRRKAKRLSFMRLYGAGANLMARETKLPHSTIKSMIEEENVRYPNVPRYQNMVRQIALRQGNPGLPSHFVMELPTGMRVSYDGQTVQNNLPALKNYPIQGYASELVQTMLGKLFRHMQANNNYQGRANLINFVHDSVWFDCHQSVVHQLVQEATEILGGIKQHFESTYPNVEIPLEFRVSTDVGRDMYSMTSFEKYKRNPKIIDTMQQQNIKKLNANTSIPTSASTQMAELATEEFDLEGADIPEDDDMIEGGVGEGTSPSASNKLSDADLEQQYIRKLEIKKKQLLRKEEAAIARRQAAALKKKAARSVESRLIADELKAIEQQQEDPVLWDEGDDHSSSVTVKDQLLLNEALHESKQRKGGSTDKAGKSSTSSPIVEALAKFAVVKDKVLRKKSPPPQQRREKVNQMATKKASAKKIVIDI